MVAPRWKAVYVGPLGKERESRNMRAQRRELRSAAKTKEIRELRGTVEEARSERQRLSRVIDQKVRENEAFHRLASHPLTQIQLEGARDQIVDEILSEILKAAEVIIRQSHDDGNYEIGISMPSMHIRRRLNRLQIADFRCAGGPAEERVVRHIDVQMFENRRNQAW